MLASRPSKLRFLCNSFWNSDCGNNILTGCVVISILFAVGMVLFVWVYSNIWIGISSKNILVVMMVEVVLFWISGLFCVVMWKFYNDLQKSDNYWLAFLKSELYEFVQWVLVCVTIATLLYIIYNFNMWTISHHYVSLPNKTTEYQYAKEMIVFEALFGIFGIGGLIMILGSCCCFYNSCHETIVKMGQDAQEFDVDQELLRLKDIV